MRSRPKHVCVLFGAYLRITGLVTKCTKKVKIGPAFLEMGCNQAISRRTESRYFLTLRHGEEIKL